MLLFKKKGCLGRLLRFAAVVVSIFVAYTIAVNIYIVTETRDDVHTIAQIQDSGAHAQAVLVLGASVFEDGTPSDILADRLEVASDLYLSGAASKIIVSGDNTDSHYNESDAMKAYCEKLGVPSEDIIVDHEGYDTFASVKRAKTVYSVNDVFIVTQAYHLYRALAIAQGLGMKAEGVAADKGGYLNQINYSLREVMARDKDFLKTLLLGWT